MGFKPRQKPKTMSEHFDLAMKMASECDSGYDHVMAAGQLGVKCAVGIPPEDLTFEQWKRAYAVVLGAGRLCDDLLPIIRDKMRIAETMQWMK